MACSASHAPPLPLCFSNSAIGINSLLQRVNRLLLGVNDLFLGTDRPFLRIRDSFRLEFHFSGQFRHSYAGLPFALALTLPLRSFAWPFAFRSLLTASLWPLPP